MTLQQRRTPGWLEWLGRFALRHLDLEVAAVVTLAGLALFAISGLGSSAHAGFVFLKSIEESSLDLRFEMRGKRPHDDRIVIVGIDEKTLQKIGSFPLPRKTYATLVNQLNAGGARVIAFDATFPVPESNSATEALDKLRTDVAAIAPPAVLRVIPPGPSVPRVAAITDGVNLVSERRIETRSVKMTIEEISRPDEIEARVGGLPVEGLEYFCTDPRPQRFEVNFRLPEEILPGRHDLQVLIGRRKLAPISLEVTA